MARAQTRLTMAAVAADSVMCLFLASMWLTLATMAAYHFGLITCGKDCLVITAAIEDGRVAFFPFFALLCPVAMLLYIIRELRSPTPTEPEKVPAPKSTVEALREALRHHPIMFGALPFLMLMFIGFVAERNSPHMERICSLISAVGWGPWV